MLLAAIGEQFSESLADDDEICGLTVSVSVINKVIRLLPEVDFAEPLYKRKFFFFFKLKIFNYFLNYFTAHQTHYAYENASR